MTVLVSYDCICLLVTVKQEALHCTQSTYHTEGRSRDHPHIHKLKSVQAKNFEHEAYSESGPNYIIFLSFPSMFLAHKAIIRCLPLANTVKLNLTLIPQEGISELVLITVSFQSSCMLTIILGMLSGCEAISDFCRSGHLQSCLFSQAESLFFN